MSNRLFRERMLVKLVGCLFSFFDMVWKEWESLFLKPFEGCFEALSGRFLGHLECMWMVEGTFGRDGQLVGNVQKIGLE